jgi:diguanylate cyclase (GGDEF)-like protein
MISELMYFPAKSRKLAPLKPALTTNRNPRTGIPARMPPTPFKHMNDTLRHAVGDDARCSFAAAICTIGRDGDVHGRLGGDEFVVAAVLSSTAAALGAGKGRLSRAASTTVTVRSRPRDVRASVGVAVFTTSTTPDEALSADAAMYLDKASKRAAS